MINSPMLKDDLKQLIEDDPRTTYRLAKDANIQPSNLYRMLSEQPILSPTWARLFDALGVELVIQKKLNRED